MTDLLRPANRGLDVTMSVDEGVAVRPLHRQPVEEEMVCTVFSLLLVCMYDLCPDLT